MEREKEDKEKGREAKAKRTLGKILRFILKIQKPTESTVTLALVPEPRKKNKEVIADYAFLIRNTELNKDELTFIEFLKRSVLPPLFEMFNDIAKIEEAHIKYDKREWTCYYVRFQDKDWKKKILKGVDDL